ncbi:hypothetical protein [Selenomonas sp. AE3005]|uniref:hypothetical protein n=1 Tax=Selenomonas sp. AE3005 TaxID=1485543 RepID=UPI0025D699BA|nr:hypothetical protein [Selenomonas sp. AE3005]
MATVLTEAQLAKLAKLSHLKSLAARTKAVTDNLQSQIDALDTGAVKSVTLTKDATATSGYAASYTLSVNDTPLSTKIDIPKDFLVKSATLETVAAADTPYQGAAVGDKYVDFVINAKDASETAEHIYLAVSDLVDVYTAGNGLALNNGQFTVTVDTANANGLSVGANGIALAVATDSEAGAMSATDHAQFTADSAKLAAISAQANKTTVTTEGGGTIEIDGVSKTIVEFAADADVATMLDEELPAPAASGN